MKYIIFAIILVVPVCFGVILGNLTGDQATIKDCATKGEAAMAGGGKIKCEIIKEKK